MSIFATIIDCLAKQAETHKYLFSSTHLLNIIRRWLTVATVPPTILRLVQLLLDAGYSESNQHADEIGQFFLPDYASTFIATHFTETSPLADVIRFLLFVAEANTTTVHPQLLIENLFRHIDENNAYSSHLLSLAKEIVLERSRQKLIQLLSSFTLDILGRTGQMKRSGTILLTEILDLSAHERVALADDNDVELSTDTLPRQQTSFFSSEGTTTADTVAVSSNDFVDGHRFLNRLTEAGSDKADQLLCSHMRPSSNEELRQDRLALITTARENVAKILDVLDESVGCWCDTRCPRV